MTDRISTKDLASIVSDHIKTFLPDGFTLIVAPRTCLGHESLKIAVTPSMNQINGVRGQYPAVVSLSMCAETLRVEPQVYGGMGGGMFFIKPSNPMYAYDSVKIPFRRAPKNKPVTLDKALGMVDKFVKNYLRLLRENRDNLVHTEYYSLDALRYVGYTVASMEATFVENDVTQKCVYSAPIETKDETFSKYYSAIHNRRFDGTLVSVEVTDANYHLI